MAGPDGLRTLELAIRTAMLRLGGSLLEDLLALDTGHRGARVDCGQGHRAEFVAYRDRHLDTVPGPIKLGRAWYPCTDCGHGVVPKDDELGVAGASLSPGLRAMVARLGAAAPFAKASDLLATLAGSSSPRDGWSAARRPTGRRWSDWPTGSGSAIGCFRELGLFVGSGAVEAGCRAVVAQRLKLSGMRWTVRGASAIVRLRCEGASGRWDDVWTRLHIQTTAA